MHFIISPSSNNVSLTGFLVLHIDLDCKLFTLKMFNSADILVLLHSFTYLTCIITNSEYIGHYDTNITTLQLNTNIS